ncbi:MMPL family transporter [Paenibacillus rhizovicinus]|uniref:MMPL family transporter n=1 Tax=Paenibacillus rhizovicinus TaxID=2704463 RepID=A0A6C0P927_9BACL|nr:MMPL family transporter [Paenibacillus rhizovicinus]QHW34885.1 MMPL family transporter [Paenibacillus rhizovicinus]
MAKYLYRLGLWAAKSRKKVLLGTLVVLIALGIAALSLGPSFSSELTIPNTPADKAGKVIGEAFGAAANPSAKIQVVFKAPEGKTLESAELQTVITDTLDAIGQDSGVAGVTNPMQLKNLSADKRIGYGEVSFKTAAGEVTEATKETIKHQVDIARNAGLQTETRGDVELSKGGEFPVEVIGIIAAFIILAITFASFLAAGLPILSALIGLGGGMLGIVLCSTFIEIQSVCLSLAAMLGLAVGIDYALFMITRFKQQLAKGFSVQESVAIANGTAGSAVLFAGVTVVIGLLGLSVARIPFLTMMGISSAFCVITTVLLTIVVLPAILGWMGHKLTPERENKLFKKSKANKQKASSSKWGLFVTKRPLFASFASIILLAVIAIPFFHINLGLPSDGTTKAKDTTERKAYDLLTEGYGVGFNASLIIGAQVDKPAEDSSQAIAKIQAEIGKLPGVQSVTPAIPAPSGKLYLMTVMPQTGPDDTKTKDLVKEIRNFSNETEQSDHIQLLVTGTTAMNIDIAQKLNDALPVFAALIVVLAYIILVLVFRSLFIPLKAVLGFLLSLGATLGFVVFVVQDGHLLNVFGFPASGPILAFLPVILIGILFGLAMDYEIFLVSKMREVYAHTGDPRKAILDGVRDSGKVVTSAGLIMISVFFGFMLAPDAMIKSIGLALAFGVLFDAFVVRMTLVPAVMSLMGKSAWYLPKWLDRILPNIDVEGESIMEEIGKKKNKKIA